MGKHPSIYHETLQGDFSVRHKVTATSEKASFHIHDEFELLLVLSDGIRCEIGDKIYPLEKNTLLLFNNMDLHHLAQPPGTVSDRYVVYFKPEYIRSLSSPRTDLLECFLFRPFADPNLLPLTQEQADCFTRIFDQIMKLDAQPEDETYGKDLGVKFLLGDLLLQVNRLYREKHQITEGVTLDSYRLIYRIISYMHENYWQPLSLDALSKQFFINKFSLCTLFKEVTGMSPNQYLINCRLMKAKELLIHQTPVEEVCGRVGYNNLSHFSRAFKQRMGVSPKKFQLSAGQNRH